MNDFLTQEEINILLDGKDKKRIEEVKAKLHSSDNMKSGLVMYSQETCTPMVKNVLSDALEQQKSCSDDYSFIIETIERLMTLYNIPITRGLLALDDVIRDMAKENNGIPESDKPDCLHYYNLRGIDRFLVSTILLVIYGTDLDIVELTASNRYFSYGFKGREALAAYLVIQWCLCVYKCLEPQLAEEILISVLPEAEEDEYLRRKQRNEATI